MNVVGRVGSLISQGVYSVATPFHPFGGAVDVIVVQQPDETFRSTPWYVRFGKFQGVIKGAEKIVRINVNGVEANFHMYLDNSGEAYFLREVDCGTQSQATVVDSDHKVADGNRRLEHSFSDSVVSQLRDEYGFSARDPIEREECNGEKRFFDFQDGHSMLEGAAELSEYGSNRGDTLDGDDFAESHVLDSEVILVSVDGHVLTAPVSASEQNTENLERSTPQFHLGPCEGTEFCEGNDEDFCSGDEVWSADYFTKLNSATGTVVSENVGCPNNDGNVLEKPPEACGDAERGHQAQESQFRNLEGDVHMNNGFSAMVENEDVFKSCLELSELAKHVENASTEENSPYSPPANQNTEETSVVERRGSTGLSPSCNLPQDSSSPKFQLEAKLVQGTEHMAFDEVSAISVANDLEPKHEQFDMSVAPEEMDSTSRRSASQYESSVSQIVEPHKNSSEGNIQPPLRMRFEISLCGSELRPGMGLTAAAEAFDVHRVSADAFKRTASEITSNKNLIVRFGGKYLTWEKAAPFVLGMAAFDLYLPVTLEDAIPVEQDETQKSNDDDSVITPSSSGRKWRLWHIPFRRVKTLEHTVSGSSNEDVFLDSESTLENSKLDSTPASPNLNDSPRKQLLRTNVPTNEQIASLNLKEGQNMITFCFSTRVLGKQQVDAHIYLWKWNARIVISDVDGTITKSDVLGQFMPLVGKDWTQSGVARLFSAIKENGYQLLFLSARAIVQAYLTRSFLLNLKQDGKALPNGPVVISPDGLFPSLFREVIRRAPHEFKIACLEDIRKLFPSDYNPFYAGFGNRDTDEFSYMKIGIPKGKIFIINPKGEVANSHRIDVKSYTSLHTLVNDMFPPTSLLEQEDYNSWNYWRVPVQDVE